MKPTATLRFFYCGKGDTILLHAPSGNGGSDDWALIDCRLTKPSGAYWRIRDIIEEKEIRRLKFVCLTHPDRDHYFGMRQLLEEHFYDNATDRLRVDEFWDSGVDFELFSILAERLSKSGVKREIDELYRDFLVRFILANKLVQDPMHRGKISTINFGEFDLLSISPRFNRVKRFNRQAINKIITAPIDDVKFQHEESNNLSVVLVLMHKTLPVNIILGGDAMADVWIEALDAWAKLLKKLKRGKSRFAAVKVSHHGAATSLYSDLYEDYCWKRKTIAILTVGAGDSNHPHKDVLKVLHKRNIRTYATCWPTGDPIAAKSHMPLPGSGTPKVRHLRDHDWADIEVTVEHTGHLKVKPRKSRIQ